MDVGTLVSMLVFMMILLIVICLFVYASRYKRVPPDQAMVVFGTRHAGGVQVLKGGGRFIWPVIEEVDFIPLNVRTLDISVESVVTSKGVMLDVEAVAQVKISSNERLLKTAAEQLLHKSSDEINYVAQRTLEGHVRGVCARLSVEEINSDRNKVAQEIQDSAGNDLASMGMEVVSFTIRDLRDQVGYLQALGSKQTARVKRDAAIGQAEYEREASIQAARALWEARRLFERYEAAGKSLFILEKALQEMDRVFVAEKSKGIIRVLEEAGMDSGDLMFIDEILHTPGSDAEARFQGELAKLKESLACEKPGKQEMDERGDGV